MVTYQGAKEVSMNADYDYILSLSLKENFVDIATSANDAHNIANCHTVNDVITDINVAYGATGMPATSREPAQYIPTSANEAYISTDVSTSDNPAYAAVTDDSFEYDYV